MKSDCRVYIGHKSRTERPRKTKVGTEVAHVTRDSDTTFKVKRSNVNLLLMSYIANMSGKPHHLANKYEYIGGGGYCGGFPQCLLIAQQCNLLSRYFTDSVCLCLSSAGSVSKGMDIVTLFNILLGASLQCLGS